MANPIAFTPKSVDPKFELRRRLDAAPIEHAEALLVAYDLLEEAHRQGILDALHGAVGARDTIFRECARYSVDPAGLNAMRNCLALGKLIGALKPEPISNLAKELAAGGGDRRRLANPPSLWELLKCLRRPEARRGLYLLTFILAALGSAAE